jgi:nicotinamidase-related amidase
MLATFEGGAAARSETAMIRIQISFCAAAAAVVAMFALSPAAFAQGVVSEWAAVKPPPPPELKTVALDPKTTALLVMDFNQANCRADKRARCVPAIPRVKTLIAKARAANALVVYTITPNMKRSDFVAAVAPGADDPVISGRADKFDGSNLDKILKDHWIKTVVAAGTSPNGAVLFTAFGAAGRGYKVVVPVDTMPGDTPYAEQSSIWGLQHDPGLAQTTLTSVDKISF